MMAVPTYGWRTFKARGEEAGTRLMRDGEDEALTFQVRESYSGPTAGFTFLRIYREGKGYTILALDGDNRVAAMAFGEKNAQAWDNIHAAMRVKGLPIDVSVEA
jgi:hypothetical protein